VKQRDPERIAELLVEHTADVITVQTAAREFARDHGFRVTDCHEISLFASELASNIVKYGVRGGRVCIEAVNHPERGVGVRIIAFDQGPPFHDFDMALRDGCDDKGPLDPASLPGRGGMGVGLGAVVRLSDEIGWAPAPGGKKVWAIRYAKRPRRA